MALPGWADPSFSESLQTLCECGEGSQVEFKEEIPQQASSLCKDIAALATSGGGLVVLGIEDNGNITGLDLASAEQRDALLRRIQHLIATIEPRVEYSLMFGYHGGVVLGIAITDKQERPVYYSEGRPYVRQGSMSRPATPDEVVELVWKHPHSDHQKRILDLQYERVRQADENAQRTADLLHRIRQGYITR